MKRFNVLFTISAIATLTYGNVANTKTPNHLHPVHGLYVKPSEDGTTGDLYVAATEDSGSKTQWLTDQPIHFLPAQSQPAIPTSYAEDSFNTKRAIASPHMHYAYAMPAPGKAEASAFPSYPYALPVASPTPASPNDAKTEAPASAAMAYPQYNPYQFFYPQMMSAYANMISVLKDSGMSDETATAAMLPSQGSPMWPHSYGYPFQYVMVDPSMWANAQAAAAPAASSTPATDTDNE